ncbi:hypothetical protein H6G64_06085 [Calothrix sp. FACHB-156]|nr:hypothetical protein [Calothrix sp. FACHB-156]
MGTGDWGLGTGDEEDEGEEEDEEDEGDEGDEGRITITDYPLPNDK